MQASSKEIMYLKEGEVIKEAFKKSGSSARIPVKCFYCYGKKIAENSEYPRPKRQIVRHHQKPLDIKRQKGMSKCDKNELHFEK